MTLLLACVAMAVRDALGTWLVIAEARGRAMLAGALDALGDLAAIGVTVLAAGQVIVHGLTGRSILVLAAMTATSFLGTIIWTKLGQRIGQPGR